MELDDLNKNLEELRKINEKEEKRVQFHSNRAEFLAASILIFQALIYHSILYTTTTTTTTTIQCKNLWIPFTLSLLPFTLFFFPFLDAATSFFRFQYRLDLNHIEQQMLVDKIRSARLSRSVNVGDGDPMKHEVLKPDVVQLLKRIFCIGFAIFVLIAFEVVMLIACRSILCDADSMFEVTVSVGSVFTALIGGSNTQLGFSIPWM
ncbi:hypothetical protein LOK49_LG07G00322 [Camellia lanceoleosa]|uniref:Uncharacterized protein n=1 Tax=Camellia lanceoleosa TaxID=1840588 RepID=A0ACC0H5H5_9ERIC|nr:hypothetical protein LOK49_LG07G00322 [Camellia lanceoleosa]